MRICYVADGRSIHTRRWLAWFAARGHEVHLVGPAAPALEGVRAHVLPLDLGYYLPRRSLVRRLREVVREIRPDVLHAHAVVPYGRYAALAGFHPLAVSAWGSDISLAPRTSWLLRRNARAALRAADMVHVGDEASKRTVADLGGDTARCLVQVWGVDTAAFSPDRRSPDVRASMGHPGVTLFLADRALEDVYRHEVLLEAAAKVSEPFALAIAGDGSARPRLEEQVRRQGLGSRVRFLGRVPPESMSARYASADVYLDAFASETPGAGSSLAVLEAMACGLPVVLARRPGLTELLGPEECGVQFSRPEDLAGHMAALVRDAARVRRMGDASRRRALAVGDRDRNLAAFEAAMERLVSRGPSP